jgi:glycosyltransferase involved in cell wall biosynthesis
VARVIAAADIGIAPTRRDDFTDFSLSTKLFEYAAMGKPVVASALTTVERYFDRSTLALYVPGDAQDLAATILRLVMTPGERAQRIERTGWRVRELSWDTEAERYVGLVESLVLHGETRRRSRAPAPAADWS